MNYLNIDQNKVKPVVNQLNILLADYHLYYQNLRTFHWNILGKNFFELHQKFENLYNDARTKIDDVAERILTLKYHPISKASQYLEISNIKEEEISLDDAKMITSILENHKQILSQMGNVMQAASKIEDEGTMDMMGSFINELEKESWMLNAWSHNTDEELMLSEMPIQ
ncbi:Dps family protein [uncultured Polaribacter sp.]|uniref:Dps family protein n=1 Tax=uncultured Polaribacter sp. TaxID=174711 RepID=UPI00262CCA72|nr:Dps family protein [uncultured Polaribacter sp.]